MAVMNTGQARVIDPILSNHARGYTNMDRIGSILFPRVTVPVRGGRVLKFGKESFRLVSARRAPGGNTKRIQYGYASDPISVVQESLEGLVPFEIMEEAQKVPGVDLGSGAVDMVMDSLTLNLEVEQSKLALKAASYGANNKEALAGASKWDNAASNPVKDVKDAREIIRRTIGRYPNTMVIGADVFVALTEHSKIVDRFKYTSSDSITVEMLARLFEVEKIEIGKAVYLADSAADTDLATDIWGGAAILAYVARGDNYRVPSFGYTYELPGMPMVEEPYAVRNEKSWIYPVTYERKPYLVGADGGFLFTGTV